MRGISEKDLREKFRNLYWSTDDERQLLTALLTECKELNPWLPIDENTPKDKNILVYAPPYQDLQSLQQVCKWHESAGFCIDELRTPTHYQELPEAPL